MFDYLIGRLVEKHPTYVVLENNGLAFKLLIPLSTYENLPTEGDPPAGQQVKIYTYLHLQSGVSESAVRLYGFITREERRLFQLLCTVQRVGPTVALRILSGTSVRDFCQAVIAENLKYLSRLRGVGPKTAQRIIMELREPLATWRLSADSKKEEKLDRLPEADITDAVLALVSLGYPRSTAEGAVKKAMSHLPPGFKSEDLVKKALQEA